MNSELIRLQFQCLPKNFSLRPVTLTREFSSELSTRIPLEPKIHLWRSYLKFWGFTRITFSSMAFYKARRSLSKTLVLIVGMIILKLLLQWGKHSSYFAMVTFPQMTWLSLCCRFVFMTCIKILVEICFYLGAFLPHIVYIHFC